MNSQPLLKHKLIPMISDILNTHSVKHKTKHILPSKYYQGKNEIVDIAIFDEVGKPILFIVCRRRKRNPFNGFITQELIQGIMKDQRALYKLSLYNVPLYLLSDTTNMNSAIHDILAHVRAVPSL